jgi:hypothetical protein
MKTYRNLTVDNEEKIFEDIYDIDGKSSRVLIYLALMKKLQTKNGLSFLNLCGQKVVIVESLLMLIMLFVRRI